VATDDARYRNLLVGTHEMDILAMVGSGITIDGILAAGPWTLDEVTIVVQRHGLVVGDDGTVILPAPAVDEGLRDALASPSPMVRKQAGRAYAHLMKLQHIQGMRAAQEISEELRRRQVHAVREWLYALDAMKASARDELARLRASSPRSARAKRVAS
jgi:hypothetical protein